MSPFHHLHHSPVPIPLPNYSPTSIKGIALQGDWMVSIDLKKDTCLQVPIHPDSHKFLRFLVDGMVYQFRALCFDISTAPQSVYSGLGSSVGHASQPWSQDALLLG